MVLLFQPCQPREVNNLVIWDAQLNLLSAKKMILHQTIELIQLQEIELMRTCLPKYSTIITFVFSEIIGRARLDLEAIKLKIASYQELINKLNQNLAI